MLTPDPSSAPKVLRPDQPAAALMLTFLVAGFILIVGLLGFLMGEFIRQSGSYLPVFGVFVAALVLNIPISQVLAQILFSLTVDGTTISFRTAFHQEALDISDIGTVYFAPNVRYNNIVIATLVRPQLISDAIWTKKSFAPAEQEIRSWAVAHNLPTLCIDTVQPKTMPDRPSRKLLLMCFRRIYIASFAIILSTSSALAWVLILLSRLPA